MDFRIDYDSGITLEMNQMAVFRQLKKIARSTTETPAWIFADMFTTSTQKILNNLIAQVLETDDKDLITLFRRAVRNYNTINKNEQTDPVPTYNKHYQKPPFLIPNTNVTLDVRENKVVVTTELQINRNSDDSTLVLNAYEHNVQEIRINGYLLEKHQYIATNHEIIINPFPSNQTLQVKIISEINPFNNKSGQGLYQCKEWLSTQCEAEGARRIFPTLDRPDVLSSYTTTIIADPNQYPCRISNGNLVSETVDDNGRATITWEDPFPKPSYLFAAVMGDFGIIKDTFVTRSGREVSLEVYVQKGKEKRAEFSLWVLKMIMKFEEDFFDREYDLDSLKMVAMPDFNAGAMENKGLLIFNESCILADPDCATDMHYFWIALVVAHEYCHNWSGNRVTIRNWFEISLKEGFTDFRCSQFMEWLFGNALVRPYEAQKIRERQFPQDASPAAHPIQVPSYVVANEIYDSTTYIKGREVFRMIKIILDHTSPDGFKLAQNAYFDRYDGQAVTFKELLDIIQEVSNTDLTQFKRWFHQPGTPKVSATLEYDAETKIAKVKLKQTCPNPKTGEAQPTLHIPLNIELLDQNGQVIVPRHLVDLKEESRTLVFEGIEEEPIPVFHHDFSAPINMEYAYSNEQLKTILLFEQDAFARNEANEVYLTGLLKETYTKVKDSGEISLPENLIPLYRQVLLSEEMTPIAKGDLLGLPTIRSIIANDDVYDFPAASKARSSIKRKLAEGLETTLLEILEQHPEPETYEPCSDKFKDDIAVRRLRNDCFSYLALVDDGKYNDMLIEAYNSAANFNSQYKLLQVIAEMNDPRRDAILNDFFEKWKHDGTILSNWIALQSGASNCTVEVLDKIFHSEGFLKTNPDHMRSLIRVFVNNLAAYHGQAAETYKYVTDRILEFGELNPNVASSYLAKDAFHDFAKLPHALQVIMKEQLERLAAPNIHNSLRHVAHTYLQS